MQQWTYTKKKRWDLIPNLVEVVKQYAKQEEKVLTKITEIRTKSYETMSKDEKIETNQEIAQSLGKIISITENYPELKSNENFLEMNQILENIEVDIANSRKYYNGTVRNLNDVTRVFPNSIIARQMNIKEEKMFEIPEESRESVKVDFGE